MALGILYVTHATENDAVTLCNSLLNEKLIACANYFPINSIFNWKNKNVNEKEIVSLIKFNKNKIQEVEKRIKELHSYEVPCIMEITASSNKEFENWIKNQ